MKQLSTIHRVNPKTQRGSALLVVLVLLAAIIAFLISNSRVLSDLGHELKRIDSRQQKKFESKSPKPQPNPQNPPEKER